MLFRLYRKHHSKQKMIKLLTIVLLLFLFSASMLSVHFITENAVHECIGINCYICIVLNSAQNVLRLIGMAIAFAFFKRAGRFATNIATRYEEHILNLNTLFSLKIRYNN